MDVPEDYASLHRRPKSRGLLMQGELRTTVVILRTTLTRLVFKCAQVNKCLAPNMVLAWRIARASQHPAEVHRRA
ncbi:unnamed protein product [Parajaminaea phylloscopi]